MTVSKLVYTHPEHLHNYYSTVISPTPLPFHTKMMDPSTTTTPQTSIFCYIFFVISYINICWITISWYIMPKIITYILSNLEYTIPNLDFPLFCHRRNPIQSNFWVRPTNSIRNFNLNWQCFSYRNNQTWQ